MLLKKQGGGLIQAAPLLYVEGVERGGLTARWEINAYGFSISSRRPIRSCSSTTIFPPRSTDWLAVDRAGWSPLASSTVLMPSSPLSQ